MQNSMNKFSNACNNFGLTINVLKTEVMYQPAPGKTHYHPCITVNGNILQSVDNFTYLGSTLSTTANIDMEVNSRISKASSMFGRLRKNVWERSGLNLITKLKVYRAAVITTLLYACETWTVYSRHARQLNHFHMSCLRRIMKIKWQDKVPDTEILERANMQSMYTLLQKAQLRWSGHVSRMSDQRLPKRLLYGEIQDEKRSACGPKKRFKDTLKTSLKDFNIPTSAWEATTKDRPVWRSQIKTGAKAAENSRLKRAQTRRAARKARASNRDEPTEVTTSSHVCATCGKTCRARIGLISHLRTHPKPQ
jgi:hypothetical protein